MTEETTTAPEAATEAPNEPKVYCSANLSQRPLL